MEHLTQIIVWAVLLGLACMILGLGIDALAEALTRLAVRRRKLDEQVVSRD